MIEAIEYFNNLPAKEIFLLLFTGVFSFTLYVLVCEIINWWRGGCGDD